MRVPGLLPTLAVAVLLAGCGSAAASDPATPSAGTEAIRVVASTNVYGDIAQAIGGDQVQVTSLIDDPNQDPHQFQGDARNQLALSKAQVVVENGGGYDDFVDTMMASASAHAKVVNVAEVSGYDVQAEGFNEHLWYDFVTVGKLAARLTSEFATLRPSEAQAFATHTQTFLAQLRSDQAELTSLRSRRGGTGVAVTEPVPLYLLTAAGLTNQTPEAFSAAIEDDTDVPPSVLADTVALFRTHQVKLLVYNAQTTGPQTEALIAAAQQNGIPTVGVTETLPDGQTYLTWMGANLDAITQALRP